MRSLVLSDGAALRFRSSVRRLRPVLRGSVPECLEWSGRFAVRFVVVDEDAGEERVEQLASHGVRSRYVERPRLFEQVEVSLDHPERVLQMRGYALQPFSHSGTLMRQRAEAFAERGGVEVGVDSEIQQPLLIAVEALEARAQLLLSIGASVQILIARPVDLTPRSAMRSLGSATLPTSRSTSRSTSATGRCGRSQKPS